MDVDGALAEVEVDEAFFEFANTANCALQHLLNEDSLLWMHYLVIALLKLAIDLDVLNI